MNDLEKKNIRLLFEGIYYNELPNIFISDELLDNIVTLIDNLSNYPNYFRFNTNGFVEEIIGAKSPDYIYGFGAEPLNFYDFKNDLSLREISIPNILFYISFIFNTYKSTGNLFNRIYLDRGIIDKHSISNLMFDSKFKILNDYDKIEILIEDGEFNLHNSKNARSFLIDVNNNKYLKCMDSYLFEMKLDIESFYPNIYTHYLSRLKSVYPYVTLSNVSDYFDFLDYFNMKINSNQTKGIQSGVFSSRVSSELLMLSIDYEIDKYIKDLVVHVDYIRYVDDMFFFSDSKEQLYIILKKVQTILSKNKLRINNFKTIIENCVLNDSIITNHTNNSLLNFKNRDLDNEVLLEIKSNIKYCIKQNELLKVKYILSKLHTLISNDELKLEKSDISEFVNYLIQLIFYNETFATRCFKIMKAIGEKSESSKKTIQDSLEKKSTIINEQYPNTLIQIWYYHVLTSLCPTEIERYLDVAFSLNDFNSIVAFIFIQKGKNKNRKLLNLIIKEFEKNLKPNSSWKETILLSQWWLPIFQIYLMDGHDYFKFYTSNNFYKVLKDLK